MLRRGSGAGGPRCRAGPGASGAGRCRACRQARTAGGGTAAAASAEAGRGGSTPTGVFVAARGTRPGRLRRCRGTGRAARGVLLAGAAGQCVQCPGLESSVRSRQPPPLPSAAPGPSRDVPRLSFLRSPGCCFSPPGRRPDAATRAAGNTRRTALSLASRTALGQPLCRS